MQVIDVYLKSMSQCPLIIVGQSGSGKTSLMAMAAKRAWDVHGGQVAVVHRFVRPADGKLRQAGLTFS